MPAGVPSSGTTTTSRERSEHAGQRQDEDQPRPPPSAPGLAITARQLVSTAARRRPLRSSSIGIATTLEANIVPRARRRAGPDLEEQGVVAQHDDAQKSVGLRTGASAKPVINDAEVSTQPVPASASNRPKATNVRRAALHCERRAHAGAFSARSRSADRVQAGGKHRGNEQEAGEGAGQPPELVAGDRQQHRRRRAQAPRPLSSAGPAQRQVAPAQREPFQGRDTGTSRMRARLDWSGR